MKQLDSYPVLEITDGNGNLLPDATNRVLATMFHPADARQREHTIETFNLREDLCAIDSLPEEPVQLSEKSAIVTGSAIGELASETYGVHVAGDLLLLILSAAIQSPKDASLARAVRVWGTDQARGRTIDGKAVAASERSILAAWSRFKPVAHLCAAFILDFDPQAVERTTLLQDLPRFLAIAESYRSLGEKHHPPAGRKGSKPLTRATTLDPLKSWRVPADLKLLEVQAPIPPLTDFTFRILSDYRADNPA
jgi:hypothetical protein